MIPESRINDIVGVEEQRLMDLNRNIDNDEVAINSQTRSEEDYAPENIGTLNSSFGNQIIPDSQE
eukprot:Pgem_evm1s17227